MTPHSRFDLKPWICLAQRRRSSPRQSNPVRLHRSLPSFPQSEFAHLHVLPASPAVGNNTKSCNSLSLYSVPDTLISIYSYKHPIFGLVIPILQMGKLSEGANYAPSREPSPGLPACLTPSPPCAGMTGHTAWDPASSGGSRLTWQRRGGFCCLFLLLPKNYLPLDNAHCRLVGMGGNLGPQSVSSRRTGSFVTTDSVKHSARKQCPLGFKRH